VDSTGAVSAHPTIWPGATGPAGVEEQGIGTQKGPPGTWEVLIVSMRHIPEGGDRMTNPWPAVERPGPPGAKRRAQRMVPPSEGRRSAVGGAQDVGALHSTVEPGELDPREPWGGKGVPSHGVVGGKHDGCTET
jgi:hypothetical protein